MRAVVVHGRHDLRIEDVPSQDLQPTDVRIRVAAAGICGSDLHYYHHGRIGTIELKEPMVLGHELAGTVVEIGPEVTGIAPGARVAVDPSRPCGTCAFCLAGQPRHCVDMRFLGSAMRFPHVQGGFREDIVVDWRQAVPVADTVSLAEAAMAEPLAVCLHAAGRAGPLLGRRVLVTGCGPIGVLCVAVARAAGAAEIVATDLHDGPLVIAARMGAMRTVNVAASPDGLDDHAAGRGRFDVMLEASGAGAALRMALPLLRPGAVLVQVGMAGELSLPFNILVAKEIELRGTFRFDTEFRLAVELIEHGTLDLRPLLTRTLPVAEARQAFDLASDRSTAMKVQLDFASA
jgi:L-idonate 5-dehydrogenase